jgi:hypothetical protein
VGGDHTGPRPRDLGLAHHPGPAVGLRRDGVIFNTNYDYLVVKLGPDGALQWER